MEAKPPLSFESIRVWLAYTRVAARAGHRFWSTTPHEPGSWATASSGIGLVRHVGERGIPDDQGLRQRLGDFAQRLRGDGCARWVVGDTQVQHPGGQSTRAQSERVHRCRPWGYVVNPVHPCAASLGGRVEFGKRRPQGHHHICGTYKGLGQSPKKLDRPFPRRMCAGVVACRSARAARANVQSVSG